jgi:hypothetical protein
MVAMREQQTMKTILLSFVLLVSSLTSLFGQSNVVDLERFDAYRQVKYYDNLSEEILPYCFVLYYRQLTPADIVKTEQIIEQSHRERRIMIHTNRAGKGYLSLTRRLAAHDAKRIKWEINEAPFECADISDMLTMSRRTALTAILQTHGDTVTVRVQLRKGAKR